MNRNILGEKVYYYTDSIENFDLFMKTLQDLDSMESLGGGDVNLWKSWTSSNDVNFIYGQTKTFYLEAIQNFKNEIGEKSEYIYNSIMKTFYDVCKDYASSLGDGDEPKIFPTFNIKKYNSGMAMGSHFDQLDGDKTLRYSMVMYLNDDYDGGEISFQLRDYSGGWTSTDGWLIGAPSVDLDYETAIKNKSIDFGIKPKANSVVIFPAEAPYFHTAHTIKSGFKYMVPGHWIHNNMDFHR
jgi:hypothetical protein